MVVDILIRFQWKKKQQFYKQWESAIASSLAQATSIAVFDSQSLHFSVMWYREWEFDSRAEKSMILHDNDDDADFFCQSQEFHILGRRNYLVCLVPGILNFSRISSGWKQKLWILAFKDNISLLRKIVLHILPYYALYYANLVNIMTFLVYEIICVYPTCANVPDQENTRNSNPDFQSNPGVPTLKLPP